MTFLILVQSLSNSLPFEMVIVKIGSRMTLVLTVIRKVILKPSALPSLTMTNWPDGWESFWCNGRTNRSHEQKGYGIHFRNSQQYEFKRIETTTTTREVEVLKTMSQKKWQMMKATTNLILTVEIGYWTMSITRLDQSLNLTSSYWKWILVMLGLPMHLSMELLSSSWLIQELAKVSCLRNDSCIFQNCFDRNCTIWEWDSKLQMERHYLP